MRRRRYELTDEQWSAVRDLFPAGGPKGGRPWRDHRQVVNGMLWVLHTGAQWRELPERYGPWETAYGRFARWRREGLYDRVLQRLELRLDREGRIDWDLFCIDGTNVRASRSAAGGRKGGSIRTSPRTTRWAAREAGGAASCTWLLTVEERPWRSRPPPGRPTRASRSRR